MFVEVEFYVLAFTNCCYFYAFSLDFAISVSMTYNTMNVYKIIHVFTDIYVAHVPWLLWLNLVLKLTQLNIPLSFRRETYNLSCLFNILNNLYSQVYLKEHFNFISSQGISSVRLCSHNTRHIFIPLLWLQFNCGFSTHLRKGFFLLVFKVRVYDHNVNVINNKLKC